MEAKKTLKASLVITTKNRKEELHVALRSAIEQTVQPEIIVIDDGSTDGTAEMVLAQFPEVKLHRFVESKGLIVRRNDGAQLAQGDIIFSIDDDAAFSTPHIIAQTLADFNDPRIGAVAIPFIDVKKNQRLQQSAPDKEKNWITNTYIGTAHAVRKEVFLQLGGYREHLVHQGEESDYCIRLLGAGHVVRLGRADPIHHFESPKRDHQRMDFYGCRNSILFAWQNVPALYLPVYLAGTTFNCLRWTFLPHRFFTRLKGILAGYRDGLKSSRQPVAKSTYLRWRSLKKNRATSLD